ncbi:hypothetical protein N8469_00300 [bacterium]|nr:hypothetical protein [bacterium]
MFRILFMLFMSVSVLADNAQEGSLNTFHGENSTTNSNNNTQDDSVSNTYNGAGSSSEIPVGSAITPSYMSNGMDTCLKGTGGSLQTVGVGFSSGTYDIDPNCDRRRDAKLLSDLGMKVAAVSRMCESLEVWKAMLTSGTPCPILQNSRLVAGKRAYLALKMQPEIYIPDYNRKTKKWYDTILNIGETVNEEQAEDIISVSVKFRSSVK